MSFYQELSNVYESIFPLNKDKINFLYKHANKKGLALDLACGAGTDVIALKKLGLDIKGLDIAENMVTQAVDNAKKEAVNVEFIVGSMTNIGKLYPFDSISTILCTGNSLVHLNNLAEIQGFITECNQLLIKSGTLIIQIINFDRILDKVITELPIIHNSKKNITFVRKYAWGSSKEKIFFRTNLIVNSNEYPNEIELIPLRKKILDEILAKSGFRARKYFGSFNGDEYTADSYATIVVAGKDAES